MAVVRSPDFLRALIRETALATLIHQRRLTPSCGGHAPTAERTVGPARMIAESLTPKPGIREHNRHKADNQTGFDVALGQSVVISAARTWRMPSLRPRSHLTLRADRHGRPAIQENPSAAPSHYRILGFIAGILLAFASEYL